MGRSRWQELVQKLRVEIQSGELAPGTRLPSESELALTWGVSRMTVHRVMQELQAARLVTRRPKAGTIVAPSKQLRNVAVVLYDAKFCPQSNYLLGISRALPSDCDLILCDTNDDPEREHDLLLQAMDRADGMIIYPTAHPDNQALLQRVVKTFPVVFVDRLPEGIAADAFLVDEFQSSRFALQGLLDRGHRRIAHFTDEELYLSSVQGRLDAYLDAMASTGTISSRWLRTFSGARINYDAFSVRVHAAFVAMMAAENPPTAIFCGNDQYVSVILESCQRLGLSVPDQFEILTVADTPQQPIFGFRKVHRLVPPTETLGQLAASRLAARVAYAGLPPEVIRLPSEFCLGS